MTNYRRHYIAGGTYFFTVNLQDRSKSLLIEHIKYLRESFCTIKQQQPFIINAIVILPDHLHTIWTLPKGDIDFSNRWRKIKGHFSHRISSHEKRSISRVKKGEQGIWQRRFWEHATRNELDYQRHVEYIHFNPVKHGYCNRVSEWAYSSFGKFVEQGNYPEGWGGGVTLQKENFGE